MLIKVKMKLTLIPGKSKQAHLQSGVFLNGGMTLMESDADFLSGTLKKVIVDPSLTAPYSILVCFARSSAESMGASIRSTVRKAAKLAV